MYAPLARHSELLNAHGGKQIPSNRLGRPIDEQENFPETLLHFDRDPRRFTVSILGGRRKTSKLGWQLSIRNDTPAFRYVVGRREEFCAREHKVEGARHAPLLQQNRR